jgi:hypothetical protein
MGLTTVSYETGELEMVGRDEPTWAGGELKKWLAILQITRYKGKRQAYRISAQARDQPSNA